MDFGGNLDQGSADLASLVAWWQEAGVDTLVDEAPRNWLERRAPRAAALPAATAAAPAAVAATARTSPAATPLPDTLDDFLAWLSAHDGIPVPPALRVAPAGDPASGLMVLIDLPEAEDAAGGRLLGGAAGDLFDKMIAAIGRSRETLYLAAMAPGRPAGGYVDKSSAALFNRLARHHVALARPRALLLMGEAPSRSLLDLGFVEARGRTHAIEIAGHALDAVATFHPRTLLQHPQQKRRAWEDLQLLMKLFG